MTLNSPPKDPMNENEEESLLEILSGAPKIMEEPENSDENKAEADDEQYSIGMDSSLEG